MTDERYAHRWDEAERVMGKEAADAMRRLYDFYGTDALTAFAHLYDPASGAFYYSDSARDNDGFLPDCESTEQIFCMLSRSCSVSDEPGGLASALPAAMREKCVRFIQSLQDPDDGYFYHPQWGKKIGSSRRGRDLTSCLGILRRFGAAPLYPTALDRIRGDVRTEDSLKPPYLLSPEAMTAYLDSLKVNEQSHSAGHILSSQTAQIQAAGLADLVCDYLDRRQNPANGLWEPTQNYSTLSGLIKIGAFYGPVGRSMRWGDRMLDSALDVILSRENPEVIIYIFNPFGGLGVAVKTMRGENDDALARGETPPHDIAAAYRRIYDALPAMVDVTIEKLQKFRKPDGSYSYEQHRSAPTTQGTPVSLGVYEGDVNGTACGVDYLLGSLFQALGIARVPLYSRQDFMHFCDILDEKERGTSCV